jgi:hypothetical protein
MFANVELKIGFGRNLVVPQEAVMDSGAEKTVFVALGDGYFQPRSVETGATLNRRTIILRGLKAGERVVTSANFLIDSESRLRSATAGMGMPGMDHGPAPQDSGQGAPDHAGHQPVSGAAPDSTSRQPARPGPEQAMPGKSSEEKPVPAGQPMSGNRVKPKKKILYWYDPMHPQYRSKKPGKAPDCGMDLVPRYSK